MLQPKNIGGQSHAGLIKAVEVVEAGKFDVPFRNKLHITKHYGVTASSKDFAEITGIRRRANNSAVCVVFEQVAWFGGAWFVFMMTESIRRFSEECPRTVNVALKACSWFGNVTLQTLVSIRPLAHFTSDLFKHSGLDCIFEMKLEPANRAPAEIECSLLFRGCRPLDCRT